jgi:hypothetical protein
METAIGDHALRATALSHGLASLVVMCADSGLKAEIDALVEPHSIAMETWPVGDGSVDVSRVTSRTRSIDGPLPDLGSIGSDDLPFAAATQVRQFNSNLSRILRPVALLLPEYLSVLEWLHQSVTRRAQELRANGGGGSGGEHRFTHHITSILVEINAGLSLLTSQALSGLSPLHDRSFPVGEYSLLGVGGMARAARRLYKHMNSVFARAAIVERVAQFYPSTQAFDPQVVTSSPNFSNWEGALARVGNLPELPPQTLARQHMIYFSSRWGFHETLHSINVSWQCLHASSSPHWNMLTLSHEFLHSHVRGLINNVLDQDDDGELEQLAQRFRSTAPVGAKEAMQSALINGLQRLDLAAQSQNFDRSGTALTATVRSHLDASQIRRLYQKHMRLLQEIVVHVLDYLYFYDADDDKYVSSLWSSWAMVPQVDDKLVHYLFRTICALSSTGSAASSAGNVFDDAVERLEAVLSRLVVSQEGAAAADVQRILGDPVSRSSLKLQFKYVYYLVRIARTFFFDETLHANLVRDDLTEPDTDGAIYQIDDGSFPDQRIESPVAFLLDRFEVHLSPIEDDEIEYKSLWQMLVMIEPE